MPAISAAPTPAAARTLAVFETFAAERRPLSNGELAKHLQVPESSCSDLVTTLVQRGYLARVDGTRKLYPTGRLLEIAQDIDLHDDLAGTCARMCQTTAAQTRESALAGRIEGGSVRVIAFSEGSFALRYRSDPGSRLGLHVSALGKAILALRSPAEAEHALSLKPRRQLADGTITELPTLLDQIERFRRQGFAWVENEGGEDLAAIAVAGAVNGVQVALSVAGPVNRLRVNQTGYLAALRRAGRELHPRGLAGGEASTG